MRIYVLKLTDSQGEFARIVIVGIERELNSDIHFLAFKAEYDIHKPIQKEGALLSAEGNSTARDRMSF